MAMIELGPRQKRATAAAITVLAVTVIVLASAVLLFLVGLFLNKFSSVFLPLALAAILALVINPWFDLLKVRLKLPTPLAIAALFLSVLIPLGLFGWFFGAKIGAQIGELVDHAPAYWERVRAFVEARWPEVRAYLERFGIDAESVGGGESGDLGGTLGGFMAGAVTAGKGIVAWVGGLLGWAVFPVYLVFFLLSPPGGLDRMEQHLVFLKPETRRDVIFLAREFVSILVSFFRGQLIIALAQGVLYAIGFSVIGLSYGFVLGLLLGFLNVIPYLGSIIGLGIGIPLAFFQDGGSLGLALGVVAVFTAVQMIEAYLLTPRIMGDRTGLHPMAIIVAVLFWGTALGGIFGMILAIPLTAFGVVVWRLVRDKYMGEMV